MDSFKSLCRHNQNNVFVAATAEAPILIVKPTNVTAKINSRVSLKCAAKGNPLPQILWTSYGQPVTETGTFRIGDYVSSDGSVISFINISRISVQEGGMYQCQAINDFGTDFYSVWISVIGPPFIKPMNNVTVVAGNALFIDCPFSAHHLSSILWYKAPPRWRIEPNDQSAIVGHTLIIDCQAYGKPEPRVLWKKMNQEVVPGSYKTVISGSRIQTLVNGSLYFVDVIENDTGLYMCEAGNGIGLPISAVIKVNVHAPARFAEKYHSTKTRSGERVELVCRAFGESPIKITWSKDGQLLNKMFTQYDIQEDALRTELYSKLIISPLRRSDSGLFTCKATNPYGSDEKQNELIVQGKWYLLLFPVHRLKTFFFLEKPDSPFALKLTVVDSKSVQVHWTKPFDGHSTITKYIVQYKESEGVWERNSKELTVDGMRTDTFIRNLMPVTSYHFRIRAENNFGVGEWSDVVSITTEEEVPESVPKHIQVTSVSSKSIKISWQSPVNKYIPIKVTGFYVGYKKYQADESFVFKTVKSEKHEIQYSCEITGLSKQTKYAVVVQAFNNKGAGPLSEELIAETAEFDVPQSPLLKVLSVDSTSIKLTWSQSLEEENPIFGYIIRYKKESEHQWHESQLMSDVTSHSLTALQCGTTYLVSMLAFNTLGRGKASDTVFVKTRGAVPIAPEKENFITVNSTYLLLNLNAWLDAGCSIDYFSIQYKQKNSETFVQLPGDSYFIDRIAYIKYLEPATWYDVVIAARNGAGVTEAQYRIATLTESGDSSSNVDCNRKESECYAMSDMPLEKPNFIDQHPNSEYQYGGDECVYLPSPYASTRIAANSIDCEKMARNQFLARNSSRSFSNVYDIPQNKQSAAAASA
ncbi:Down syndrome cell adhesion molecule-like protein Dscam2, partial [Dinothrombium tinctorium]